MISKSHNKTVVTGQLSEKARRTLHKRSRALSINLAAAEEAAQESRARPCQGLVGDARQGRTDGPRVVRHLRSYKGWRHVPSVHSGGAARRAEARSQDVAQLRRGAARPGRRRSRVSRKAVRRRERLSPIATSKPGFTDTGKGFVLGAQMLGDAARRYLWLGDDYSTLGQTSGTREGWNEEVGKLLQYSSFATIAVLTVLASPVPAYILLRKSEDPRWRPAVSETAIINFAGDSASGKTLATAIAASLSGDPSDRAKWDFSRRGLEEYLHTRNEVGAIFDDVEKHTGESMTLRRAITTLTQSLPDGASKVVSRVARDHGLPRLTWSTFGLSSSPRPIQEIAREEGWIRSLGEQVRLIDLCVPPSSRGGIFDAPPPGTRDVAEFSRRTAKQMERGIALHFGHVMPAWIEVLLADDHSADFAGVAGPFRQNRRPRRLWVRRSVREQVRPPLRRGQARG